MNLVTLIRETRSVIPRDTFTASIVFSSIARGRANHKQNGIWAIKKATKSIQFTYFSVQIKETITVVFYMNYLKEKPRIRIC